MLRGETGPSGGPAFTDLLGVCVAFDADGCVVQPETGPAVRIPLADIVTGKPVPPRPSVRHRVDPREAHLHTLALWPDLETSELGAWVLRHSAIDTARRANSALAIGSVEHPDPPGAVIAHYRALNRRPTAAVVCGSAEEAALLAAGWVAHPEAEQTLFQLAGVSAVRRKLAAARDAAAPVSLHPIADGLVEARSTDRASGIAAFDRDWVGFRSITTAPEHRRRGLALAVMAALLDWGAEQGARTAHLQVRAGNLGALALYDRLGFVEHHRYRYLIPRG